MKAQDKKALLGKTREELNTMLGDLQKNIMKRMIIAKNNFSPTTTF